MCVKGIITVFFYVVCEVFIIAQRVTMPPKTTQWALSDDFITEVTIPVDTVFNMCHRYRITDKYSPFNAWPGNYGQPLYQINFFERITHPGMFLYRYYYPFMYQPSNPVFMNTRVPFTEMVFTFAGPREMAEQTFRIRHSRNVNRFLNFGLVYDIVNSLGQYSHQRTDNKTFTLFSSYTGERYKLYFAAGLNSISTGENGGITDEEQLKTFAPRDVGVRLGSMNKAKTALKNENILIVQRFLPGGNKDNDSAALATRRRNALHGTITHIFIWEKTRRSHTDNYPLSGFYDTSFIYISRTHTFDSLSERSIRNTIRFDFSTNPERKFRLGGGAGISNELWRFSQIIPSLANPPSDTVVWQKDNNLIKGSLFNNIGERLSWKALSELYITGWRAGDFDVKGSIQTLLGKPGKPVTLNITGGFSAIKPSFWYFRWGSNYFIWENDFLKEYRVNAGAEMKYPSARMKTKFNYAIIDNYTSFGPDSMPSQHKGGLSVASLFLEKELSAWKFHLSNQILVQKSSNSNVLDFPLITIRSAGFFEHNFQFKMTGGNLNTQIGVELFYNTPYYGYGYVPSTGAFISQNEKLTGNYPYLSAFLNAKIRRSRIFLSLDHFNSGFTGYNYFMVPRYPMIVRTFRYGIAWTFYD